MPADRRPVSLASRFSRLPFALLAAAAVAAAVGAGCAGSSDRGAGRPSDALDAGGDLGGLLERARRDSTDAGAWRRLGAAQLRAGRLDEAAAALARSRALAPDDAKTLVHLAALEELRGDLGAARALYQKSALSDDLFSQRKRIRTRILQLTHTLDSLRARELIERPASPSEDVVAVYAFSATDTTMPFRVLGKGIAAMLITDLKKVRRLTLVERLKLEALVQEIERSQGASFDERERAKAGRIIGAESSVSGSVVRLEESRVRLNYFVVDSRSQDPFRDAKRASGELDEVLRLQKEIAYGVLEQLEIDLSEAEKAEIGKIPTSNVNAFVAYCEGLDLLDRGLYSAALAKFQEAAKIDPGFQEAKQEIEALGEPADEIFSATPERFLAQLGLGEDSSERSSIDTGEEESAPAPVDARFLVADDVLGLGDGTGDHSNPVPPVRSTGSVRVRVRLR